MAESDGNGAKPGPQGKGGAAEPADRPEAFGRGEHPEPKKDDDQQTQGGDGQDPKRKADGGQKDGDPKGDGKKGDGKDDKKEEDPKPFWKRPVLLSMMIAVAADRRRSSGS